MMSSGTLFCLSNSPKNKEIKFTVLYEKAKQQILTSERLELANCSHFCLKNNGSY